MVSDLLEFIMGYTVPRYKQMNRSGKNNSEHGTDIIGYKFYKPDMEMDAFAYAYAVMTYKYGEVKYLYVPKAYRNNEFNKIVNEWQVAFKNEGL